MTSRALFSAVPVAVRKLHPRRLIGVPVLFLVEVGAAFTLLIGVIQPRFFTFFLSAWLWATVFFGVLAEAVAEGRGQAQAASLRGAQGQLTARRVEPDTPLDAPVVQASTSAQALRRGDHVLVLAGEVIPADGDVVAGSASVDESAITGESAPVIREAGGDRCAVTGGTTVLSDRIIVRISNEPGQGFMDRMIGLVEGSRRHKTPNELALNTLLTVLTVIFVLVVLTLAPVAAFAGAVQPTTILVALLVCLIPTTIGALLSAIGIAGMDRLVERNVLAMSGRAVEAAGDVSTLLLDKTGTITMGDRRAVELLPVGATTTAELALACQLSSYADDTPEGRSVRALADSLTAPLNPRDYPDLSFLAFSAQTRTSGARIGRRERILKGAASEVCGRVARLGGVIPARATQVIEEISASGGTALAVTRISEDDAGAPTSAALLGVIHLKDVVKPGMAERFAQLRRMGIRTVMVTGDNALTARAIAAEAGVDDVLAEATPEDKLALIRREQAAGRLVAMTGDGTNDAPALAQADVGVAMNTGTSAAKEAANMIDLDSDPTKLIDIVHVGKQLLMTRGALTTFSIANDVAKYFAIIPAMFSTAFPGLAALNVMGLHSPHSAIAAAVIFNALVIAGLIPLALRGVAYRPRGAAALLRRNLAVFGLGGVLVPFLGIKALDLLLSLLPGGVLS
ncbi:potassium-transporting ATPase subunit KdpB [Corynebacterium sp. zg-331]|uniref:potassium-transporting ATPase subunit KdpB n=1 Tax=unclassified Corynebacterium TaxID=2624378 RepID=UPI00128E003C|nr:MULTISPECIES: potassium-transporting ATPase subunit KdpB [unclassified Corynebacterium]MBC3185666.1 potassium-transporting ATPase subunit KdpB [Corynebacterium sp. zg-331]MPV52160.1 potassium-transporting ATPase subunit KdpB [Corynebacterium sp. zg331]